MVELRNCLAPAKLNLFLHVFGRRPDGYHELQSAIVLIDWCDRLHFVTTNDGLIKRVSQHDYATADQDIVIRAAQLLQSIFSVSKGVLIEIEKNIPCGAGMGGGSSDAATTLFALNRLWGLRLSKQELMEIGLILGADVPFFLSAGNAWVEGVGEKITPMEWPQTDFLVCYPNENISTAQIFKSLGRDIALTCDRKKIRIQDFLEKTLVSGFDFCKLSELSNDLQGVALKICPKLLILYDELIRFGKPRMTGSGSAFFVYRPFLLKQNLVELSSFGIVKVLKSIEKHPFIVYK